MVSMKLTILFISPLLFTCIGVLLPQLPATDDSIVDEATVAILKSCYTDHLKTLVIAGKFHDFYNRFLQQSNSSSVILIDHRAEDGDIRLQYTEIKVVVVISDTTKELHSLFEVLRKSNCWNTEATYFIIGSLNKQCRVATDFLNVAWKMNLLSSLFLCEPVEGQVTVYTFNPFTSRAPIPWIKIEQNKSSDDPWTLFSQPYTKDRNVCENLNFGKMKFMDGYKIRGLSTNQLNKTLIPGKKYGMQSLKTHMVFDESEYYLILFITLNVTPIISYDLVRESRVDLEDFLNPQKNDAYDILLNLRVYGSALGLEICTTRPYSVLKGALLTRHRGFLTPAEKVARFYESEILILTGLVLIFVFLVLAIHNSRGFSSAFFETLRLILGNGFLNPLDTSRMKIIFMPIFLLFIILDATFRGNIISFLTKPEHRGDVESLNDLKTLKFHIYSTPLICRELIHEGLSEEYCHVYGRLNCSLPVIQNATAACVGPSSFFVDAAWYSHLHLRIIKRTEIYLMSWVRKDWPLTKKINTITARLSSSGLPDFWEDAVRGEPLRKLAAREEEEVLPVIRKLCIEDVAFAFVFLAVGLVCSTIVFVVEIFQRTDQLVT